MLKKYVEILMKIAEKANKAVEIRTCVYVYDDVWSSFNHPLLENTDRRILYFTLPFFRLHFEIFIYFCTQECVDKKKSKLIMVLYAFDKEFFFFFFYFTLFAIPSSSTSSSLQVLRCSNDGCESDYICFRWILRETMISSCSLKFYCCWARNCCVSFSESHKAHGISNGI